MTEVVAEMAKKIDQKTDRNIEARNNSRDLSGASAAESGTEGSSLDCRYRQIGISAVAAFAANPVGAPAAITLTRRRTNSAASAGTAAKIPRA